MVKFRIKLVQATLEMIKIMILDGNILARKIDEYHWTEKKTKDTRSKGGIVLKTVIGAIGKRI